MQKRKLEPGTHANHLIQGSRAISGESDGSCGAQGTKGEHCLCVREGDADVTPQREECQTMSGPLEFITPRNKLKTESALMAKCSWLWEGKSRAFETRGEGPHGSGGWDTFTGMRSQVHKQQPRQTPRTRADEKR